MECTVRVTISLVGDEHFLQWRENLKLWTFVAHHRASGRFWKLCSENNILVCAQYPQRGIKTARNLFQESVKSASMTVYDARGDPMESSGVSTRLGSHR